MAKISLLRSSCRVAGAVACVIGMAWIAVAQPSFRKNRPSSQRVDPEHLRKHVAMLSETLHPRDWRATQNLDQCAEYIAQNFRQSGAHVEFQSFRVGTRTYKNVIGKFNPDQGPRIVIGAHYDACGTTPGADDNASGIASLLELASLLGASASHSPVDLVAYTLEEPPFFRTAEMGSAIHAKSISTDKSNYRGVIVLEMVGCFKDTWGSQAYPMPLLHLFYPNRGNFISVVGRWDQGDWVKSVRAGMKGTSELPVYSIRAPAAVPGIDFSDHMNYWPYGIPAVMITDTAFYRSKTYHENDDTAEKLDFDRMAQVVIAVFEATQQMAKGQTTMAAR